MAEEESSRPYNLVCGESKNISKVLDTVENQYEFLSNNIHYKTVSKNHCSYVQIPEGSRATFVGFFQQADQDQEVIKDKKKGDKKRIKVKIFPREKGFIFSVYLVVTPKQEYYAVNSIYPNEGWRKARNRQCGADWVGSCLLPKKCAYYFGLETHSGFGRQEVVKPSNCEIEELF
jgi:hypothetical protein